MGTAQTDTHEANWRAYDTLAPGPAATSLFEDRGSRFFGHAVHVESAEEAVELRHDVMRRIPEASHYVSAWTLRDGAEAFSDAKEPHGTAGMPVLSAIKGRGLLDVVCVVARVFGGTLLGKGGLMRAYTTAASRALDTATPARALPCALGTVRIPYALFDVLKPQLPLWGATVEGADFAADVTMHVCVPAQDWPALEAAVTDFTRGEAVVTRVREAWRIMPTPEEAQ